MMRLTIALSSALILLRPLVAEELLPQDVRSLVDQRASAIAKIDKVYVEELEKLKLKYTREGNLDIANKIVELSGQVLSTGVYLDDLPSVDVEVLDGLGTHGKDGKGAVKKVDGQVQKHALFTHPTSKRYATVSYLLDSDYSIFKGRVAVAEGGMRHAPLTFKVIGDNKLLWKSRQIADSGKAENFSIPISGIKK